MPVYRKVNKDFFKKWTREMSYVLGFFAADGYITINKRGGQFWCIQIKDKKLLEKIKRVVNADHKIGVRKKNKSKLFRLQIGSIEMCDDLKRLGFISLKTNNLKLPKIPNIFFSDFVRGYFDGDGNVWTGIINLNRKTPTLSIMVAFTSCSNNFLLDLKLKLSMVGLNGGALIKSKDKYSRLQYSVNDSLKLANFMYNHYAKVSGLYLARKKKVFEKFIRLRS